jgi:tyrosyl-tRNA synthetase
VGLATSNGDAIRSIEGRGIKVNGNVVTESRAQVNCNNSIVVSKGRNKFFRVVFE